MDEDVDSGVTSKDCSLQAHAAQIDCSFFTFPFDERSCYAV